MDFNSFTAFRILFICQTCFCCYSSPSPINWNVSSKRIGILSVLFSPGFQCKEHCLHVAGSAKWSLELLICSFPSLSSASANGATCSPYLYLNQKVGVHPWFLSWRFSLLHILKSTLLSISTASFLSVFLIRMPWLARLKSGDHP